MNVALVGSDILIPLLVACPRGSGEYKMAQHLREKTIPFVFKGLFIWAKIIPVNEKTFRLAKYFSVHMEKRYPAYRVKFPAVT